MYASLWRRLRLQLKPVNTFLFSVQIKKQINLKSWNVNILGWASTKLVVKEVSWRQIFHVDCCSCFERCCRRCQWDYFSLHIGLLVLLLLPWLICLCGVYLLFCFAVSSLHIYFLSFCHLVIPWCAHIKKKRRANWLGATTRWCVGSRRTHLIYILFTHTFHCAQTHIHAKAPAIEVYKLFAKF